MLSYGFAWKLFEGAGPGANPLEMRLGWSQGWLGNARQTHSWDIWGGEPLEDAEKEGKVLLKGIHRYQQGAGFAR